MRMRIMMSRIGHEDEDDDEDDGGGEDGDDADDHGNFSNPL